jgi:hypothetical protein
MNAVDIIIKKRDHQTLTKDEIDFFITGIANNEILIIKLLLGNGRFIERNDRPGNDRSYSGDGAFRSGNGFEQNHSDRSG